jgi:hypothetical protein
MSPAVCLGGSVRTAFELGAACADKAKAHIAATVKAYAKGERTKGHRAALMQGMRGCKVGMCKQFIGKLSRLG